MVRYYTNQICDAVYQRNGLEYRRGKNKTLSTKTLALTLLGCMLRRLYKRNVMHLGILSGLHGMTIDLDKYIYPCCLNKLPK
jgi:hypothetical protein